MDSQKKLRQVSSSKAEITRATLPREGRRLDSFTRGTSGNLTFGVFLSHNSADKPEVVKLATKLKELGLNPWLDAWHLMAGEPWLFAIERAMDNSNSCAIIIGPNGLGNVHEDEMWVALQRGIEAKRKNRQFRVIPILLPNATRGDRTGLPTFLTANTWVEFQNSIDEPAAIDRLVKAIRGESRMLTFGIPKGECPYRGLACFDVQHSPLFFGRESLTDWLLSRLRGTATKEGPTRFLAIMGASGSGKSSLARAGVLAKLKAGEITGSDRWPQLICRPENRPIESLATALASLEGEQLGPIAKASLIRQLTCDLEKSPDQIHLIAQAAAPLNDPDWRLVILVDQFEELFTLNITDDSAASSLGVSLPALSADRVAFLKNLLYASSVKSGRVVVILTMRADFYAKCVAFPDLAAAVSRHQELVGPMGPDELRRAIETPAQLVGSDIESGLVELLTHEVTRQPSALPLLQYALAELWGKARDQGLDKLSTSAYRELGGWEGALSQRADAVFVKFKGTPSEDLCRQLFLRLVQPGEGTDDTKRLVRWRDLLQGSVSESRALEPIVQILVDNRLLSTDGSSSPTESFVWQESFDITTIDEKTVGEELQDNTTIELVHEALIRSWPQLRRWLDADRSGLRTRRRLGEAAREWVKSHGDVRKRDRSLLFSGTRLAVATEWADKNSSGLNHLERSFLEASIASEKKIRKRMIKMVSSALFAIVALVILVQSTWFVRKRYDHANTLVQELAKCEISDVPHSLESIAELAWWGVEKKLRNLYRSEENRSKRLRYAMALLRLNFDPTLNDDLVEQLPFVKLDEFPVVRNELFRAKLGPGRDRIMEVLWNFAEKNAGADNHSASFQAACALATFVPTDPKWDQIAKEVCNHLVKQDALFPRLWIDALRPAKGRLINALVEIYSDADREPVEREMAAKILTSYEDRVDKLCELIPCATVRQFVVIYPTLEENRTESVNALEQILSGFQSRLAQDTATELATSKGLIQSHDMNPEDRARGEANILTTLLRLHVDERVWEALQDSEHPQLRSNLIHDFGLLGCDPNAILARCFDDTSDVTGRRALLLSLGEFTEKQLSPSDRTQAIDKVLSLYLSHKNPGIHGAAEYLLRRWGRSDQIVAMAKEFSTREQELRDRGTNDEREWYVNRQGQTFTILQADVFEMGSPLSEPNRNNGESLHQRHIERKIAIATKEVTRDEFKRFLQDDPNAPDLDLSRIEEHSPTGDSPQIEISWYAAAQYCNWLSKTEGIEKDQWCYEWTGEEPLQKWLRTKTDFLKRTGYRLPTEAEWEFACRAKTKTIRYFGTDISLLNKYEWVSKNPDESYANPVARLKPNEFGLFDMLGNVSEFCQDVWSQERDEFVTNSAAAGMEINDTADEGEIFESDERVCRGASYVDSSRNVRCAIRTRVDPRQPYMNIGFRPARTYP